MWTSFGGGTDRPRTLNPDAATQSRRLTKLSPPSRARARQACPSSDLLKAADRAAKAAEKRAQKDTETAAAGAEAQAHKAIARGEAAKAKKSADAQAPPKKDLEPHLPHRYRQWQQNSRP